MRGTRVHEASGNPLHDGYLSRAPSKVTAGPRDAAKRESLRLLWDTYRTLYSTMALDKADAGLRGTLEAEGHESPNRIPPREVADWVKRGSS